MEEIVEVIGVEHLKTVLSSLTPEEIVDIEPYINFLSDEEPDCTVTFEYVVQLPELAENITTDSEISFATFGDKSMNELVILEIDYSSTILASLINAKNSIYIFSMDKNDINATNFIYFKKFVH